MVFVQRKVSGSIISEMTFNQRAMRGNHAFGRMSETDLIFADLSPVPLTVRMKEVGVLEPIKDLDVFIQFNTQLRVDIQKMLSICHRMKELCRQALGGQLSGEMKQKQHEVLIAFQKEIIEQSFYKKYCPKKGMSYFQDPLRLRSLSLEEPERAAISLTLLGNAIDFFEERINALDAEILQKKSSREDRLSHLSRDSILIYAKHMHDSFMMNPSQRESYRKLLKSIGNTK